MPNEARPVSNRDQYHAYMDVIELMLEDPLLLGIIDYETHIWRYPTGLNGRQIGANDLTPRMLVSKFYCPNSSSSFDVKNMSNIVRQRRKIKFFV